MPTKGSAPTTGHVVVCGLDHLGLRTIDELRQRDEAVVAIGTSDDNIEHLQELDVRLVVGDLRVIRTLRKAPIDFSAFDALTFDCYGTLIDWEAGILAGLRAVLGPRGIEPGDDELLERYAGFEADLEAGPYLRYREVLSAGLRSVAASYRVSPSPAEVAAFGGSVLDWPAFPDSAAALVRLKTRFKLGVITNCDDDLFAASNRRLGVEFDWIVTAQQVGSYKPDPRNFEFAFSRIEVPRQRILHVAQSLFHDHVPAKALGMTTVWIDRRAGRTGFGATPPASAVPDLTVPDMATLAELAVP